MLSHAVHTNYYKLKVFASVLSKFSSKVSCAKAILNDYGKYEIYIRRFCCNVHNILTKVFGDDPVPYSNLEVKEEGSSLYIGFIIDC